MTVKAKDIINMIEKIAPLYLQEEWDNSGLQIGDQEMVVSGILLCVDVTDKSVECAINNNCNFIFSHHPFFFGDLKSIDFSTYKGELIKQIISNNLFVYSAHTNLDASINGVNSELANRIGLQKIQKFSDFVDGEEIGVFGEFAKNTIYDLIEILEGVSKKSSIRLYGRPKTNIKKVAVIGGSGSFGIDLAKSIGADVLVTGDIKHHDGQKAYENDLLLIDIGHFYSEYPVLDMIEGYVRENFNNINIEKFSDPVYLIK